jgi:hypothetical protein
MKSPQIGGSLCQGELPAAVARTLGLVEEVGHLHDVESLFQGTIMTTDGERLWAFRYSSEGRSRSLFYSSTYETLKELYPDDERLDLFDEETRCRASFALLGQLDRVTVGVCHPREAKVGQEVVRGAERGSALGSQARVVAVHIVSPEHDLDRTTTEVRV